MPRIRTIKPEFWESETVASLSIPARLLFIACLNLADDEGRLRWNSAHLKAFAFPYDDDVATEQVTEWMAELLSADVVKAYQAASKPSGKMASYGVISGFLEHQRINRPQPSKYPGPPPRENEMNDSVNESLNQCAPEGKGREGKGRERKGTEGANSTNARRTLDEPSPPETEGARRARKHQAKSNDIPIPETLDTPDFRAAWAEWFAYRQERRLTMSDRTIRAQLKKLSGWGVSAAISSIEASITNGWQGLFEAKGRDDGRTRDGAKYDPNRKRPECNVYDSWMP